MHQILRLPRRLPLPLPLPLPPISNSNHSLHPKPSPAMPGIQVSDPIPSLHHHLRHCRTVEQLSPLLSRLIVTGLVNRALVLHNLIYFLSLSADQSSSLLLCRLLSRHHFHQAPNSTTFLYNVLIRSFSNSRHPEESICAFVGMLQDSSDPDHFTFPFLAKASAKRNSVHEGGQTHNHVLKRGFDSDVYVVNNFLSMYSVFGDMGSVQKLFDSSSEVLDVVSWNTLINGYLKAGRVEVARKMFDEMPVRDEISWSSMISGYAGKGELDIAQSLFDRMPAGGLNVVTWNSMVSGFSRHGLLSLARKFFDEMPARNVVSWNAMISGYALSGEVDSARELFDKMPEKDVVSWSSMISAYTQGNRHKEALELFKKMQLENSTRPNEVTLVSVLSACAHLAALDQGKWIHAYIDRNQLKMDDDDNLGAALIDMYAKCGSVDMAVKIFHTLGRRNVSVWNALITGLAINGEAHETIDLFEKMRSSGTNPNDITFLGVLTACTHGGLVIEGRRYFESMEPVYGIRHEMKHYGCIVDLLGRAGLLEDAEEIIRNMPMKPDIRVLGALLGACRIHRNVSVADRIRVEFLELGSREAGCHVLLSNIYAAAGRWTDASEMRSILKKKNIKKVSGSSSVEMDGAIYEFIAGDWSHPQTSKIHEWLDEMHKELRLEGYTPATEDVLLDLNLEEMGR